MAKHIRISTDSQVVDAREVLMSAVQSLVKDPSGEHSELLCHAIGGYQEAYNAAQPRVEAAREARAEEDARLLARAQAANKLIRAERKVARIEAKLAEAKLAL